jgi:hypothetical protein
MALSGFAASAVPATAQSFSFGFNSGNSGYTQVQNRGNFQRRGDSYYYNNHRGYRDRRPGYRYHNGWWFPPAAFVFGSIIGGAIASGIANQASGGSAHVAWCHDRYRSYRSSDNTFQPYNGPRQQCISPYR